MEESGEVAEGRVGNGWRWFYRCAVLSGGWELPGGSALELPAAATWQVALPAKGALDVWCGLWWDGWMYPLLKSEVREENERKMKEYDAAYGPYLLVFRMLCTVIGFFTLVRCTGNSEEYRIQIGTYENDQGGELSLVHSTWWGIKEQTRPLRFIETSWMWQINGQWKTIPDEAIYYINRVDLSGGYEE